MPVDEGTAIAGDDSRGSTDVLGDSSEMDGLGFTTARDTVEDEGEISDKSESAPTSEDGGSQTGEGVGDAEEEVSGDASPVTETVSAEQFDEAVQLVGAKMDALNTMGIVVVVALFFCAGIIAVQTLIRSMEWF